MTATLIFCLIENIWKMSELYVVNLIKISRRVEHCTNPRRQGLRWPQNGYVNSISITSIHHVCMRENVCHSMQVFSCRTPGGEEDCSWFVIGSVTPFQSKKALLTIKKSYSRFRYNAKRFRQLIPTISLLACFFL